MPDTVNSLHDNDFPNEILVDQIDNFDVCPHSTIQHADDAKRKLETYWDRKALNIRTTNPRDD